MAVREDPEAEGRCPLNSPALSHDSAGPLCLHPQNGTLAQVAGWTCSAVQDCLPHVFQTPTSSAGPLPPGWSCPSRTGSRRSPGGTMVPAAPARLAALPRWSRECQAVPRGLGQSRASEAVELWKSDPDSSGVSKTKCPPAQLICGSLLPPCSPLQPIGKTGEVVVDLTEDCVI